MTFSLHKSTAMTDMQAVNKQPQHLDVNGDANVELSGDTELNTPESSFSQLFSLFNSDNKTESKVDSKTLSAASNSSVSLEGSAIDAVDGSIIADELSTVTQDDSEQQVESSDDFLARLGQSSMLLQGNVTTESVVSVQNNVNGNELPLQAGGANIASIALGSMKDISVADTAEPGIDSLDANMGVNIAPNSDMISSDLVNDELVNSDIISSDLVNDELMNSDTVSRDIVSSNELTQEIQTSVLSMDPAHAVVASTLAEISEIAGMTENKVNLSKGNSLNEGGITAGSGLLDRDQLDGTEKPNFAASLGEPAMAKSTPFGQVNGMAASIAGTASGVADTNSTSDLQATSPAEPVEQLDFAQIMESARKQEPLEQTTRTMTKAPVLTDTEQQVLEKRVNLNNNLASSELNEKIAIMAGKELQSATIRLDPAELGSMNIKLVVQNDQLNVTIQAQNHQSRDLLEQQMPRLREMLQQQGMTLGETQVQADGGSQQQSAFQQSRQENGQKNSNNEANYAIDSQTEAPATTQYWQDSAKGVDFYA